MKRFALALILLIVSISFVSAEKTIFIDRYHDTENWWGNPDGTASLLFQELSNLNFNYRINNSPIKDQSLRGADIVLLWDPNNPFEDSEIDALSKFVRSGGSVLLIVSNENRMIDPTRESVNKFLAPFGMRVMKNSVDDPRGCCGTPLISVFSDHPTTKDVSGIIMYRPASIELGDGAFALAMGSELTYALGTEPLEGMDIVVAAASEEKGGKVAVIGSSFIFDNGKIGDIDNRKFAKNLFLWLGENDREQKGIESRFPIYPALGAMAVLILLGYIFLKRIKN